MTFGGILGRLRAYPGRMDSDKLASMTASIVRGVPKKDCHWVTDDESSKTWDEVKASVDEGRRRFPNAVIDIPNEMPSV